MFICNWRLEIGYSPISNLQSLAEMTSPFQHFIDQLAQTELPSNLFNQYSYIHEINGGRRHNLRLYLMRMAQLRPQVMLVAEAPGYRGCRLTGVPFVSPFIMRHGLDDIGLFGRERGYQTVAEWPEIQREASATIVWQTLLAHNLTPLLWNVLPFHPHRPGNPQSNRTPKTSELRFGESFLRTLLELFPVKIVVAVGNKAESALTRWDIPFQKMRHPAQGGKKQFVHGIEKIVRLQ